LQRKEIKSSFFDSVPLINSKKMDRKKRILEIKKINLDFVTRRLKPKRKLPISQNDNININYFDNNYNSNSNKFNHTQNDNSKNDFKLTHTNQIPVGPNNQNINDKDQILINNPKQIDPNTQRISNTKHQITTNIINPHNTDPQTLKVIDINNKSDLNPTQKIDLDNKPRPNLKPITQTNTDSKPAIKPNLPGYVPRISNIALIRKKPNIFIRDNNRSTISKNRKTKSQLLNNFNNEIDNLSNYNRSVITRQGKEGSIVSGLIPKKNKMMSSNKLNQTQFKNNTQIDYRKSMKTDFGAYSRNKNSTKKRDYGDNRSWLSNFNISKNKDHENNSFRLSRVSQSRDGDDDNDSILNLSQNDGMAQRVIKPQPDMNHQYLRNHLLVDSISNSKSVPHRPNPNSNMAQQRTKITPYISSKKQENSPNNILVSDNKYVYNTTMTGQNGQNLYSNKYTYDTTKAVHGDQYISSNNKITKIVSENRRVISQNDQTQQIRQSPSTNPNGQSMKRVEKGKTIYYRVSTQTPIRQTTGSISDNKKVNSKHLVESHLVNIQTNNNFGHTDLIRDTREPRKSIFDNEYLTENDREDMHPTHNQGSWNAQYHKSLTGNDLKNKGGRIKASDSTVNRNYIVRNTNTFSSNNQNRIIADQHQQKGSYNVVNGSPSNTQYINYGNYTGGSYYRNVQKHADSYGGRRVIRQKTPKEKSGLPIISSKLQSQKNKSIRRIQQSSSNTNLRGTLNHILIND
jgi:hypothetical protein